MAMPELFSVVVLGSMNPAIHHPQWYRHRDLLTLDEVNLALAGPDLVVTPGFAQFSVGKITVTCVQQRWAVQTTDQSQFQRVVTIAKQVMDTLTHTPISVVGINFDFCRPSGVRNIGALLAARVHSLNLGFEGDGVLTATASFSHQRVARLVSVLTTEAIAPDPTDPLSVSIKYNVELRMLPAANYQEFNFAELLDEHLPAAITHSAQHLARTLDALRRAEN